jgi:hypothetical protein
MAPLKIYPKIQFVHLINIQQSSCYMYLHRNIQNVSVNVINKTLLKLSIVPHKTTRIDLWNC